MPSYLQLVVPYRNRRRRSFSPRRGMTPIQSFKQITIDGPASRAAATTISHSILTGVDNYTGPSAANNEVPTGAKVMSVILMLNFTNLVSVSSSMHINIQCIRSGGAVLTPGAIGGNPLRNQIIHTRMVFLGHDQNNNFMFSIKIPTIYQRIREGDSWLIIYRADTVFASQTQAIYKFYR